MAKTSKTTLNSNGESGHLRLIPDFRGYAFNFLPLKMFALGLSYMAFIMLRYRKWQPTPVFLPGKSHGWSSLVGYCPWGRKELDTTERLHYLSM